MRTTKPLSDTQKLNRSGQIASNISVLCESLKSLDEVSPHNSYELKLKITHCIAKMTDDLQRLHGADDPF
jgi:hypothetical protein